MGYIGISLSSANTLCARVNLNALKEVKGNGRGNDGFRIFATNERGNVIYGLCGNQTHDCE